MFIDRARIKVTAGDGGDGAKCMCPKVGLTEATAATAATSTSSQMPGTPPFSISNITQPGEASVAVTAWARTSTENGALP